MKTYDLALTIIRALVVVEIVREVVGMVGVLVGAAVVLLNLGSGPSEATSMGTRIANTAIMGSAFQAAWSIVISLAIWFASRPLARFVARFSTSDAAIREP